MWLLNPSSFAEGVKAVFGVPVMCPDVSDICPYKREIATVLAMGDGRRRATWDRRSPEAGAISVGLCHDGMLCS